MLSLRQSDRGATAIEYAIIAGLIGLGLVGSLVTTRGSLSAVFGTAGSQMSSATVDGSPASGATNPGFGSLTGTSNSARAGYWQAKTLAAAPTKTVEGPKTTWSYAFTDGTTAQFSKGEGGNYSTRMYVYDPVQNMRFQVATNGSGTITADIAYYYNASMQVVTDVISDVAYSDTWNGITPNTQRSRTYTYENSLPTSTPTSSSSYTVTAATTTFQVQSQTGYQDLTYFQDASK